MPVEQSATWRSPGRVNLIGEHTDYNDGWTLPLAVGFGCTATASRTEAGWTAVSAQVDGEVRVPVSGLRGAPEVPAWSRYVLGAAWLMYDRGLLDEETLASGLRIEIDSDVPLGAGLSSSAAVVCSVVRALDDLLGTGLGDDDLLALSREVENRAVGAPTGGMDQLASLRGVEGHALVCDMRSLVAEPVPFEPADHGLALLVVDTRTPHAHADGEYAARRSGCERAAAALGVPALRDATLEDLDRLEGEELRLARHVVTEDARVLEVADLLRQGRLPETGPLLTASHVSMRDDFAITVPRVDVTVEALLAAGALGARMTGGGFGGCVIALVAEDAVEAAGAAVLDAYAERGWEGEPVWFTVRAADGAHRVG